MTLSKYAANGAFWKVSGEVKRLQKENSALKKQLSEAKLIAETLIGYVDSYDGEFNPYEGSCKDRKLALDFISKLNK